jgi:hypothetical protein
MRSGTQPAGGDVRRGCAEDNFANSQNGCNDSLTKNDEFAHRRTESDITSRTAPKVSPTGETAPGIMIVRAANCNIFNEEVELRGSFAHIPERR